MKTLILLASIILAITQTYAQDTLMLRNGDELIVRTVQINESILSYRSLQSTDTVLNTMPVSSIFMIKYSTGTKQVFSNTTSGSADLNELVDEKIKKMQTDSDYARYSRLFDKRKRVGIGCTAAGGTLLVVGIAIAVIGDLSDGTKLNGSGDGKMAAGVLCSAAGLTIAIVGAINLAVMPKYKKKRDAAAGQLSFYPVTQPILPAGNVYGSTNGLAMKITF